MRTAGHKNTQTHNNDVKNHAGDEDADDHLEEAEAEDDLDPMQVDGDGETQESESSSSELPRGGWAIAGIVKKKIIFSKRPMPVIGKQSWNIPEETHEQKQIVVIINRRPIQFSRISS